MEIREIKALAAAIILQAVNDYVDDVKVDEGYYVSRDEIENFISSSWFDILSLFAGLGDSDPKTILAAIKKRAKIKDIKKEITL